MNEKELGDLVYSYNQAEADQQVRLELLYKTLHARKGARRVEFGNGHCWSTNEFSTGSDAVMMPRQVGQFTNFITKVEIGEDNNAPVADEHGIVNNPPAGPHRTSHKK